MIHLIPALQIISQSSAIQNNRKKTHFDPTTKVDECCMSNKYAY